MILTSCLSMRLNGGPEAEKKVRKRVAFSSDVMMGSGQSLAVSRSLFERL